MKLKKWPQQFKDALHILKRIEEAGYQAYFVGGSVRDNLLDLPIHDVDIATSAYPQEIKQIFSRTIDTGIDHGTVTVMDHDTPYEITTFRTESGYQDFRRPDKVTFVRSLKDDLQRRDFTINALAVSADGEIIDEFNGLNDLDAKLIKAVGKAEDRFQEDALRMMRAIRFQSQLGFDIEKLTKNAIVNNAKLLSKISVERINVEFVKMMLAKDWKKGLENFIQTELFKYCPMMDNKLVELNNLLKLKNETINSKTAVWSLITKELNINDTNLFLTNWKESNQIKDDVKNINKMLNLISEHDYDKWKFYQLGNQNLEEVFNICLICDIEIDEKLVTNLFADIPINSKKDLAIDGKMLIKNGFVKPGPILGNILNDIEKKVVLKELENNEVDLLNYVKNVILLHCKPLQ